MNTRFATSGSAIVPVRRASRRLACCVLLALPLVLLTGCQITPPRVDPYTGLIQAGTALRSDSNPISRSGTARETVYLVLGANYLEYQKANDKFMKMAESGSLMPTMAGLSMDEFRAMHNAWAPKRTTSLVVDTLRKHFARVQVADDFAEAQANGAQWIVLYDHAHVQTSTATASWSNTTSIDLLTRDLVKVVGADSHEDKSYGAAWGNGDVLRFARYRGEDIVRSITTALLRFDARLDAARSLP